MTKILLALLLLTTQALSAQEPELKGGLETFVLNNKVYPLYSLQNCIEGTVSVSFKLNKEGEVYYSEVRNGIGTDLDDEALRLIRMSSGKWKVPDNYDTALSILVPINFKLSGYNCGDKSKEQIQQAIRAYKTNKGLTDAVLNFYRNKANGKVTTEEEEHKIISLRASLGYDNEYLNQRIAEGERKLKLKDKQGACEDFLFVKYMGSDLADELLAKYCN